MKRWLRILAAAALVTALFAGSIVTSTASPPGGPTELYFPWVPYGEVIEDPRGFPDSGPYYGLVTVQNLENEPVTVRLYATHQYGGLASVFLHSLDAYESRTFTLPQMAGEAGTVSTGVEVISKFDSDDGPARVAAVMRQVSPSIPDTPSTTSGAHITVSGYTALTEVALGSPSILPVAQTNSNWNTRIHVTNFHTIDQHIFLVSFHPAGGGPVIGPFARGIDEGETVTLDLLDLEIPDGWVGYARITSVLPIAAVAERVKNETNMLIMNPSRREAQSSQIQTAGLVFRDWNHWNTGISLVNLEAVPNDITVTYLNTDGGQVHVDEITLEPSAMDFIYLPASPEGEEQPFVGSAIIEGTGMFHGAVDEVKYFGDDPDTGHAMSYTVDYLQALPGESLALPLFKKGDPIGGGGDTSGIQVFNLYGNAEVEILILNEEGQPALPAPLTVELSPHEGYTVYSMDLGGLPSGFTGSAIVSNLEVEDESSGIVAVSNLVNYDVQYDGSASFNLIRFDTPEDSPGPPNEIIVP